MKKIGLYLDMRKSYGYLAGTYVRDKDAVIASMLICEMTAYYRTQGISLIQARENMYREYGVFAILSIALPLRGLRE